MPVLRHEPEAGAAGKRCGEVVVDPAEDSTHRERDQDRGPQVPLVHTESPQVQPGAEGVSFDPDDLPHEDVIGQPARHA